MHSIKNVTLAFSCVAIASPSFATCEPKTDVLEAIRCLPGVTAQEVSSQVGGYRQFEIQFDQPADHQNVDGEHFKQRLVLLHKSFDEPMVLQTSGYSIFKVGRAAITQAFGTNQIQVEHRFFSDSVPKSHDWAKLTIAQSAADFHAVTEAFKQLYRHRWVNTGASKGGMTSVYHRHFYPQDLDGTVADVAPLSLAVDDERYINFVEQAGGDKYGECRAKLEALQMSLLRRRDDLLPRIRGTFTVLGGKSVSFEHAVIEMPFAFWQYQDPTDSVVGCDEVPSPDASLTDQLDFFLAANDVAGYSDDSFTDFAPYYFQAGTQLGSPAAKLSHLGGLRKHDYMMSQYMPKDVKYSYSNTAMLEVRDWVVKEASGIVFVYGEFDPWTAGAFPQVEARDVYQYIVPGGNHGSNLFALPSAEKKAALKTLAGWLDKQPVSVSFDSREPALDVLELKARQHLRLP